MTIPTSGEARSRQTAYEATEHWWKSRLEAKSAAWRKLAAGMVPSSVIGAAFVECADELERLIRERTT